MRGSELERQQQALFFKNNALPALQSAVHLEGAARNIAARLRPDIKVTPSGQKEETFAKVTGGEAGCKME